tara:strand:- start:344 stop:1567 length:1224 start_codon:yes stop_codon:yes gene_type:complete
MANGPYPQYPVMGGPSLQSVMGRQRMGIEDAMYAAESQRERQSDLMEKGAKGAYEYDKMLRGFMEAKYANPDLTFWDYASKPSVGAAFRKQGREKIAEATLAGKEIEGMGIGARHKAGLKGIFGRDRPKKVEPTIPYNIETKRRMDEAELSGVGAEKEFARREAEAISKAKSAEEQKLLMEALDKKNLGKGARTTMVPKPVTEVVPESVKEGLMTAKEFETAETWKDTSDKSKATYEQTGKLVSALTKRDVVTQGKFTYDGSNPLNYAQQKKLWQAGGNLEKAVEAVPGATTAATDVGEAVAEEVGKETAKGGLKTALGAAGSALALGGGLYTAAKGDTTQQRVGGGVAAAGGAAGLIAATNFWNPVGWAAAIPAALSIGGGALTATGGKSYGSTPHDSYRRRIGII